MSDITEKLKGSIGAITGLQSTNNKQNQNNNQNTNENDNSNDNINHNSNNNTLEDRIESVKIKGKAKRKIKNVTFGLYEDQQEALREIAETNDLALNEFMRESMDMIIDIFNDKLKS